MKEKLIEELHSKLVKEFQIDLITKKDFEEVFPVQSKEIQLKISNTIDRYKALKTAKRKEEYSQVSNITSKEEYIIRNFGISKYTDMYYMMLHGEYSKIIKECKKDNPKLYGKLDDAYQQLFKQRDGKVWKYAPFFDFFRTTLPSIITESKEPQNTPEYLLKKSFLQFINSLHYSGEENENWANDYTKYPDSIMENFKEWYINKYSVGWNLLGTFSKYLSLYLVNIHSIGDYGINVGQRSYHKDGYRLKNDFCVYEGKWKIINSNTFWENWNAGGYRYVNTSDCKEEITIFASLILLTTRGRLVKISVSPTKLLEYNEYIIYKDVQKVNILDDSVVQIHIHKHYDPETIVFDSEDKAFKFLSKISQQRENRQNFERHPR